MKLTRFLTLLALAVALPFATPAKDQLVRVAEGVTGAWLQPDGAWDGRTVLFLHGFADDMDGAGDLTKHAAEFLAAKGIASLRINFRGEGDRKRTDIESTFPMRLADTASAYAFLLKTPGVAKAHIGVVGWSLGASTAIETCGEHPDWFSTLLTWSSPFGDQYQMFLQMPFARDAIRDGVGYDDVPGWKKIKVKREFFESFKGYDLAKAIAKYHGPFLTLRGSEDFLEHADEAMLKASGSAKSQAIMIGGADHVFKVFNPELGLWNRAIEISDRWLEENL